MKTRLSIIALSGVVLSGIIWGLAGGIKSVSAASTETPVALRMLAHEDRDNDADTQLLYGLAYLEGRDGLKPDAEKAAYWLRRSARIGNAYAQLVLGKCYAAGKGVAKDADHAVKWWRKSAQDGNAQAQYLLGKAYLEGQGVAKDPDRAIGWLTKAAEQNNTDAQYLLGKMYFEGYAVERDKTVAQNWLSRAAKQGKTDAINLLAIIRDTVSFATKIYQESAEVLIERAKNGDPQAQYELGLRYESGAWDVNQDNAKALLWLTRAAKNGNRIAMAALADIYRHGNLGVPVDTVRADAWEQKAADRLH